MSKFLYRVIKVWLAAGLWALGLGLMVYGVKLDRPDRGALVFGVGAFLVLSGIPLMPWLTVQPWLYLRSYWTD